MARVTINLFIALGKMAAMNPWSSMSWFRAPLLQSLRYSVPFLQLLTSAAPAYRQPAAVTLARHSSQQPARSVGADAEELKRRAVPGYENLLQDDKFDDNLVKVYSLEYARKREWNKFKVKSMVDELKTAPGDTGSTPVQIGALTVRIQCLTEHMRRNKKDKNCLRSLIRLVHRRRKLLKYLQRKDFTRYHQLLSELNLRHPVEQKYKHK